MDTTPTYLVVYVYMSAGDYKKELFKRKHQNLLATPNTSNKSLRGYKMRNPFTLFPNNIE